MKHKSIWKSIKPSGQFDKEIDVAIGGEDFKQKLDKCMSIINNGQEPVNYK